MLVYTWGKSGGGDPLGLGETTDRSVPTKVTSLPNVIDVSLGITDHCAAITENGDIYTWGDNISGQLGNVIIDIVSSRTPTKVNTLSDVVSVSLGYRNSAAITANGNLYTWGYNSAGQLGLGYSSGTASAGIPTPTRVESLTNVIAVSLGGSHSAAITADRNLYTWGRNYYGQLGQGKTGNNNTPTQVVSLTSVVGISLAANSCAAITASGDLFTWGSNENGQLGHGDRIARNVPTRVTSLSNVVSVCLGQDQCMALTANGDLYTWGYNGNGQLGFGDTIDRDAPQLLMSGVMVPSASDSPNTPHVSDPFTMGEDNYPFTNSSGSFGYPDNYRIPPERYTEIYTPLAAIFGFTARGEWGGNCFGISATSYAFETYKLKQSDYQTGVDRTFNFNRAGPRSPNSPLTRLIELYQISQFLPELYDVIMADSRINSLPALVTAALSEVRNNEDGLIIGVLGVGGGHALVAYGIDELGGNKYSLSIYDCNQPDNHDLRIDINLSQPWGRNWVFRGDTLSYLNEWLSSSITFIYGEEVFNAVQSALTSKSDIIRGSGQWWLLAPADADIKNMQDVSVENIPGAQRYELFGILPPNPDGSDPNPKRDTELWAVPTGDYTITTPNQEPFWVMAHGADSTYRIDISPEGEDAAIIVGSNPRITGPAVATITDFDNQGKETVQPLGADGALGQPSSWAIEEVNAAIAAGLVPQFLQSKYQNQITRAEYCALAVTLYEQYTGAEITGRVSFSDTNDVNVEKMAAAGVVRGVGENKFDPDGLITREQAATLLSNLAAALGKPLPIHAATFADNSSISSYALQGAGQVLAAGIMTGVGDNTFAPKNPYTREQSIITMLRLWKIVEKQGD